MSDISWGLKLLLPDLKKSCPTVQFSSVTPSCPTLCDPMDCSMPGLPIHHQLLEFIQMHVHWIDMNWFLCFTTLIASKSLSLILYFLNYKECSAHRFNECLWNEWMNEGVTQLISTGNGRLKRVWTMTLEKKGEAIRDIALKSVMHQRNFICIPFKMEFWQKF